MLFDDQYLEEIKNRIDIVELVSSMSVLQPGVVIIGLFVLFTRKRLPLFYFSRKGIFIVLVWGGGNIFHLCDENGGV